MRQWVVLIAAVILLVVINIKIYQKEQILAHGTIILLELAPVDPRSLMQGDYMRLRYKMALLPALWHSEREGYLVVEIDENQVAHFKRRDIESKTLQANEILLQFRHRGDDIRLGSESFFFQEGHAPYYEKACYGELRVASSGEGILVGLRDAEFNRLGPPQTTH